MPSCSKLSECLAAHEPAPFTLLQYDPESFSRPDLVEGPGAPVSVRAPFRVLFTTVRRAVGFPRHPDGEHYLELLAEYRIAGITWRLNGKQPTLFSFLRQAGVELPESPAEQRRLYEGGGNSLLAKYAAKFADRPASFWHGTLTAERAQETVDRRPGEDDPRHRCRA